MSELDAGSFTGTGVSTPVTFIDKAYVLITGEGTAGEGTVHIERSTDDGVTFNVVSKNSDGDAASYAMTSDLGFHGTIENSEGGAKYQLNCTTYVGGTITYRIGK